MTDEPGAEHLLAMLELARHDRVAIAVAPSIAPSRAADLAEKITARLNQAGIPQTRRAWIVAQANQTAAAQTASPNAAAQTASPNADAQPAATPADTQTAAANPDIQTAATNADAQIAAVLAALSDAIGPSPLTIHNPRDPDNLIFHRRPPNQKRGGIYLNAQWIQATIRIALGPPHELAPALSAWFNDPTTLAPADLSATLAL